MEISFSRNFNLSWKYFSKLCCLNFRILNRTIFMYTVVLINILMNLFFFKYWVIFFTSFAFFLHYNHYTNRVCTIAFISISNLNNYKDAVDSKPIVISLMHVLLNSFCTVFLQFFLQFLMKKKMIQFYFKILF